LSDTEGIGTTFNSLCGKAKGWNALEWCKNVQKKGKRGKRWEPGDISCNVKPFGEGSVFRKKRKVGGNR